MGIFRGNAAWLRLGSAASPVRSRARRNKLRLYGIVMLWESSEKVCAAGPLGNHQLAATFLFQRHGLVKGGDGALGLRVGRRLGGDALQPQAGSGHQREQRSAMPGSEADDLIGNSGDDRQQGD